MVLSDLIRVDYESLRMLSEAGQLLRFGLGEFRFLSGGINPDELGVVLLVFQFVDVPKNKDGIHIKWMRNSAERSASATAATPTATDRQ
jgi:hypothetical protein